MPRLQVRFCCSALWANDEFGFKWTAVIVLAATGYGATWLASLAVRGLQNRTTAFSRPIAFRVLGAIGITMCGAVAADPFLLRLVVKQNRQAAEMRVRGLYDAGVRAISDSYETVPTLNPAIVLGMYKGPEFEGQEWKENSGIQLRAEGYYFRLHLPSPRRVVVYALPLDYAPQSLPGLCLDSSGELRCPKPFANPSVLDCVPCPVVHK